MRQRPELTGLFQAGPGRGRGLFVQAACARPLGPASSTGRAGPPHHGFRHCMASRWPSLPVPWSPSFCGWVARGGLCPQPPHLGASGLLPGPDTGVLLRQHGPVGGLTRHQAGAARGLSFWVWVKAGWPGSPLPLGLCRHRRRSAWTPRAAEERRSPSSFPRAGPGRAGHVAAAPEPVCCWPGPPPPGLTASMPSRQSARAQGLDSLHRWGDEGPAPCQSSGGGDRFCKCPELAAHALPTEGTPPRTCVSSCAGAFRGVLSARGR